MTRRRRTGTRVTATDRQREVTCFNYKRQDHYQMGCKFPPVCFACILEGHTTTKCPSSFACILDQYDGRREVSQGRAKS